MRITGGHLRSRRLEAPAGGLTRPTSDRVREALFSVLAHHIDLTGAAVVDVFAGSGALGFEAISRGADHAFLLEESRAALRSIAENAKSLGVENQVTIVPGDALRTVGRGTLRRAVRVAFFDPPYAQIGTPAFQRLLETFHETVPIESEALLVVEHRAKDSVALPRGCTLIEDRSWGDTGICVFCRDMPGV